MNGSFKAAMLAIIVMVCGIVFFAFCGIENIKGHELGVKENWNGVVEKSFTPGKYVFFRPTTSFEVYDMRVQNFIMNDKGLADGEVGIGRANDSYKIQTGKGKQDVTFKMALRWRLDPLKLIAIHKAVRQDMAEKVIRNNLQRTVKDKGTIKEALDIYSGQGLVDLQQAIEDGLRNLPEFVAQGVLVEGYLIEDIDLDPKYEDEIRLKQLAVQKALRMEKEALANLKEADAQEAQSQIALNKSVVEAEAKKQVGILEKEQEAAEIELVAKAKKAQRVFEAEGLKESNILEAEGLRAMLLAEAEGQDALKKAKYDGEAGELRASVEIANLQAEKLKGMLEGIQIIPEKTVLSIMGNGGQGVKPVIDVK